MTYVLNCIHNGLEVVKSLTFYLLKPGETILSDCLGLGPMGHGLATRLVWPLLWNQFALKDPNRRYCPRQPRVQGRKNPPTRIRQVADTVDYKKLSIALVLAGHIVKLSHIPVSADICQTC